MSNPQPTAAPPRRRKQGNRWHALRDIVLPLKNKKLAIAGVIVASWVFVAAFVYRLSSDRPVLQPLPQAVTAGVSFPVYYPQKLTDGYNLQAGSAKVKADILFFTMVHGSKKVYLTEQQLPYKAVNLNSLPNHNNLNLPIGQAIVGSGLGNPSVVIMTPETLIELTSTKGVSRSDVVDVASVLSQ